LLPSARPNMLRIRHRNAFGLTYFGNRLAQEILRIVLHFSRRFVTVFANFGTD
jgi:hypothetical protein